jgi:hypothetical protein
LNFVSLSYAQEYCKIPIQIDVINESHRFFQGRFNEVVGHYQIKGTLETCKGRMSIEVFVEDSILFCKGGYLESLDTLKAYTQSFYLDEDKTVIEVFKYFEPLKEGDWYFYDGKGNFLRREEYKRGIKIRESTEE